MGCKKTGELKPDFKSNWVKGHVHSLIQQGIDYTLAR